MNPRLAALPLTAALVVCASCGEHASEEPSASSTSSPSVDVIAQPSVSGHFLVAGKRLLLRCWGTGSPAIVLEAGTDSSGFLVFPTALVRPLAEEHATCVYDRLGTGSSDPPTKARRSIDEVVSLLHRLLDVAGVEGPVILVGSSGGGNLAVQYAVRYGREVAGLGLLDVPAPSAHLDEEFPGELGWRNPEHIDWVAAERQQSRMRMPVGDFPVLVVTASDGQSDEEDQAHWLDLSDQVEQVVMTGGHDIHEDDPQGVAEQILITLG